MLSQKKKMINIPKELESMIPGFLSRRDEDLKQIESYFEKKNFEEIRKIGHKMKGNGLSYGFGGLSAIGKDLEKFSKLKDFQKVKDLILELEDYLKYAKAQV